MLFAALEPGDIAPGWSNVIVALITIVGGSLIVQVFGLITTKRNRDTIKNVDTKVNAIRDHTVNSHTDRNMREEMDERNDAQMQLLNQIVDEQKATRDDVGGIRAEIRQQRKEHHSLSERVTALEK